MVNLDLEELIQATGGRLLQGEGGQFSGVSVDSRKIRGGEVFFALQGERHEGHHFLKEAAGKGAKGAVVQRKIRLREIPHWPIVLVGDTLRALGDMAQWWRKKSAFQVVAITGSNGKTTTKEMLSKILGLRFRVGKNPGNYNNLVGLPLSLLSIPPDREVVVVEMGMNRRGEIRRLTEIARPSIGVITTVDPVHLEGLGDLEGVKEAKGEMLQEMGDGDTYCYNEDNPWTKELAQGFSGKKVSFGQGASALYRGVDVKEGEGLGFRIVAPFGELEVKLRVLGRHHLYSALAAAACAHLLGVGPEEIREGLEGYRSFPMRMELMEIGGVKVINDAYNANPASMRMALETLASRGGRRVALLGTMAELGDEAPRYHEELGQFSARLSLDLLLLMGEFAPLVAEGAISSGMNKQRVIISDDRKEMAMILDQHLRPGDWLLVKGSRMMEMERVLKEWEEIKGRRGL